MKLFFLLVEVFIILWIPLSILRKKDLSIVYFPLFTFSYGVINSILPSGVFLLMMGCMVGYYVLCNLPFVLKNPFSVILVLYFSILFLDVGDYDAERKSFIQVISIFLLIGVVPEVYKKYSRNEVFNELSLSAFLILIIFISNALFSTVFKFSRADMYGITEGVLFGNIVYGGFNILPLLCFVVFQRAIKEKKILYYLVFFVATFLTLLTLRRSVMILTVLASIFLLISLVEYKNLKKLIGLIFGTTLVTLIVIYTTGFSEMLIERYEKRNLDNRELKEEKRFEEVSLVYKDLFVYYDYSPWFGYGLFEASGNYGKGTFGGRNLHTDLTVLIHSSGFLGLFLYLGMVGTVFWIVWKKTENKFDFMQFFFISVVFATYFITGRYTGVSSTIMIYLILCIPLSGSTTRKNDEPFNPHFATTNFVKPNESE